MPLDDGGEGSTSVETPGAQDHPMLTVVRTPALADAPGRARIPLTALATRPSLP